MASSIPPYHFPPILKHPTDENLSFLSELESTIPIELHPETQAKLREVLQNLEFRKNPRDFVTRWAQDRSKISDDKFKVGEDGALWYLQEKLGLISRATSDEINGEVTASDEELDPAWFVLPSHWQKE